MDVEGAEGSELKAGAEEQEVDATTTDECPPPPAYYKKFADADSIAKIGPPSLDAVSVEEDDLMATIQNGVYGGLIASLGKRHSYDTNIDYRTTLKERVDGVLNASLELTNDVPPKRPIEESTNAIQASLEQVHELLGEYRHHEARSNLIKLRDLQIEELAALEKSIDNTINCSHSETSSHI